MKRLALLILTLACAALLAGCASSGLTTKNIAGTYNAGPTRSSANTLKLYLKADHTFLLFARPPSTTAPWKLVSEGRWKASGRTLKLLTPSKPDEKYKIQGFSETLVSSKKNSPKFIKETNAR